MNSYDVDAKRNKAMSKGKKTAATFYQDLLLKVYKDYYDEMNKAPSKRCSHTKPSSENHPFRSSGQRCDNVIAPKTNSSKRAAPSDNKVLPSVMYIAEILDYMCGH